MSFENYELNHIRDNLQRVNEIIDRTAVKSGRERDSVQLMAVTKNQKPEYISLISELGMRLFGESRVQQFLEKEQLFPSDSEIHFIGHLQSNKINKIIGKINCLQSLDSIKTAKKLDQKLKEINDTLDVLLEINTSGEENKEGLQSEKEIMNLCDFLCASSVVNFRGLMTMAPYTDNHKIIRKSFSSLRLWKEKLENVYAVDLPVLSMGMSNDYVIAIEEGSTMVRLGTTLFGERQ